LNVSGGFHISGTASQTHAQDGLMLQRNTSTGNCQIIAGRAGGNYTGLETYVAGASGITKRYNNSYDGVHEWFREDGATGVLKCETNGDVKVNDGNLKIATSGHGIDFSANSHAGGMTSETLDSYEEGTWTATAANSVTLHSNANGCGYTKIGRLVTVTGQIRVNSDNSNDSFYINNLPFTSADTDDQSSFSAGGCRIWSWDINVADHVDIVCSVSENSSALEFWVNRDGQSAIALPASAGSYIAFSLTYPAA
jgi:hypothetical protein